jgi:transcriptional regulator of PTS gene
MVGKIGHLIIDPTKDYCPVCKRRGCLESLISLLNLKKEIHEKFKNNKIPILTNLLQNNFDNFSISLLFQAAQDGSIEIHNILKKSASMMAQAIINSYVIAGSNKIVLYGDFFNFPLYLFLLESYIKEYQLTSFWDKISISSLNNTQEYLASCVLVINNIFNTHLEEYYTKI